MIKENKLSRGPGDEEEQGPSTDEIVDTVSPEAEEPAGDEGGD